ncbi:MAG TPA: hypothetical protein DDY91_01240 [Planctomycetaceae bacterium]|nr:hypothetical protein [Planctomycetaceae bacterium]
MFSRTLPLALSLSIWLGLSLAAAPGAEFKTTNFQVSAPTPEVARKVGEAAEQFRRQIALEWLGKELPRWSARCPIKVRVGQIGAGGATTFNFHPVANRQAEVCDWNMEVQGSLERILDSVIPHEVSHTIFACYFRRPLPRWADEGAATLVEIESERRIQTLTVNETINTRRRIPLRQLLAMKEYPTDQGALRVLYAQGYSLAQLLVQEGGKQRYLAFLEDAHRTNWDQAIARHYPHKNIDGLEQHWQKWVMAGSPELSREPGLLIADGTLRGDGPGNPQEPVVLRGQEPEAEETPAATDRTGKGVARPQSRDVAGKAPLGAPVPQRRSQGATLGSEDSADLEEHDPYLQPSRRRERGGEVAARELPPSRPAREMAVAPASTRPSSRSNPTRSTPSRTGDDLENSGEATPSRAMLENDPLGPEEFPSAIPAGRARIREPQEEGARGEPRPKGTSGPRSAPVPRRRPQYSESPAEFQPQLTMLPEETRESMSR